QLPGPAVPRSIALCGMWPDGVIRGICTEVGGLYCSTDSGRSFSRCPAAGLENVLAAWNYYLTGNSADTMFFSNFLEFDRSGDSGHTWSAFQGFKPGVTHLYTWSKGGSILHVLVDSSYSYSLLRSRNGGITWDTVRRSSVLTPQVIE